ncbi:unnamed protein product [Cylicostephanus goldi]|uniref:Ig-like domain-containing protein n=1 Tax=Cylicostephanus goldi TaxID=71465 RepID=A0A3P7M7D8_CYLGO|nr:unnamed protein product [Cylicostephanus goldi]
MRILLSTARFRRPKRSPSVPLPIGFPRSIVRKTRALRICTRQAPPVILQDSMGDTVALLGQDVDFTCKVDNLGKHMVLRDFFDCFPLKTSIFQVAFVRASTPPRLISFDEKIFRQKDKYELKPKMGPMNNEWILTVKNVQETDRGNYSCQVNADPVLSSTAELDVKATIFSEANKVSWIWCTPITAPINLIIITPITVSVTSSPSLPPPSRPHHA